MSVSTKQLKELETRINDNLYENIKLLTYIHPPTKDFETVFDRNMFLKSNKTAFQQVIYYLCTVLDPQLTKEKITAWPLYDVKLESTFRTQVVSLINAINSKYKHAEIPNLMISHLVSPGGLKFAKFMLKLSMLVLYETLSKEKEVLQPIRPHKDSMVTNTVIKTLKQATSVVKKRLDEKEEQFNAFYDAAVKEAEVLVAEQTRVNDELHAAQIKLNSMKEKAKDFRSMDSLNENLEVLKDRGIAMENLKELCEQGQKLLAYLSSDKPVLDFKKNDFVIPPSVKHLIKIDDELNLHCLFNSLNSLLEQETLDMPVFTLTQLDDLTRLMTDLNEKYGHLDQRLSSRKSELMELSESFTTDVPNKTKRPAIIVTDNDDSVL